MILSPSLLSCDFGNLATELASLESAGLYWVHWDVMDGIFVPNITFGPPIIGHLRKNSALFFDVHLMIDKPERYLEDFAKAGADMLVVHAEATLHLHRTLTEIHRLGMKAGVSLNPSTPVSALEHVADLLDLVLVMSVNPGFGGQSFIPRTFAKLAQVRDLLGSLDCKAIVQVDGGVSPDNTRALVEAGADCLVSGSAFFNFPPYADRARCFATKAAGADRKTYIPAWAQKPGQK